MLPKICPVCHKDTLRYNQEDIFCTSCSAYRKHLGFLQRILVWTAGKWWWWRLPIVMWFGVMLKQNLGDPMFAISRLSNPFSALDLGIHELGHILFTPFGIFMQIAGGSLFQCIFPIMGILGCLQKKWYFGATMCFSWLGLNLFDVATYAADARARLLPLTAGLGGLAEQDSDQAYDQAHDWYQLLSRTHHLQSDQAIAHGLRIAGTGFIILGMALASFLILNMIIRTRQKRYQPGSLDQ